MIRLTEQCLENYLEKYGWAFKRKGEKWHSGWMGQHQAYPLIIQNCETWVSFEVEPLFKGEIDWESWPELACFILNLNSNCRMMRLGIKDEGLLCLSMDVFSRNFTYSGFSDALGVLGYFADYLHTEITEKLDRIGYYDWESA